MNRIYIIIFSCCLLFNCGSGTFKNDPKTWDKVFGGDIPKEVEILNSRFWKSAHWSYEYELFLKFNASKKFVNSFFIEQFNFNKTVSPMFDLEYDKEKPKWFVPKGFKKYSIWQSQINHMILLKDKTSNTMFLYALQL